MSSMSYRQDLHTYITRVLIFLIYICTVPFTDMVTKHFRAGSSARSRFGVVRKTRNVPDKNNCSAAVFNINNMLLIQPDFRKGSECAYIIDTHFKISPCSSKRTQIQHKRLEPCSIMHDNSTVK